jgi:dextransucrase
MTANAPRPRRRRPHPAQRARVVTAILSAAATLGLTGSMLLSSATSTPAQATTATSSLANTTSSTSSSSTGSSSTGSSSTDSSADSWRSTTATPAVPSVIPDTSSHGS